MEIIVEPDPNLGKDLKHFFEYLLDNSIKIKNILFGTAVGLILLFGVIIFSYITVSIWNFFLI